MWLGSALGANRSGLEKAKSHADHCANAVSKVGKREDAWVLSGEILEMKKLLLALALLFLLPLGAHATEQCPDGDVKYDVALGAFVYGAPDEPGDPNRYRVDVEQLGTLVWWSPWLGCNHCAICVSDAEGLHWQFEPDPFGSWEGADHIVWWGSCQIPCRPTYEYLPYRNYVPLVIDGGMAGEGGRECQNQLTP